METCGNSAGPGSDLKSTDKIRIEIPILLKEIEVKSMLDIPCADFNWINEVDLDFLFYIGADIVEEAITKNQKNFSKSNRKFIKLDIKKGPLPKVDLIFCRDLFIHLPFKAIWKSIDNIKKSQSTYLLTTSFTARKENKDILTGKYRPLNLLAPPFSFPKPLRTIKENLPPEKSRIEQKSLLLWRVSDLPSK